MSDATSTLTLEGLKVLKGHGTENDFVIVPDLDDELVLSEKFVAALCDRRAGIGADGVLRVVRRRGDGPEFFMDYRNADGSVAEMCGNGLRVFVRYLLDAGLVDAAPFTVTTRGGDLAVVPLADGRISVNLGRPTAQPPRPAVSVAGLAGERTGVAVDMPNPHVVVTLEDHAQLEALDLSRPPLVNPPLPHGQNVEFIVAVGDHQLQMRVHERGSGETRSCGTGIGAVVAATGRPDGSTWQVQVPGGICSVRWDTDGDLWLTGPAVIVAVLELDQQWLIDNGANIAVG